MEEKVIESFTGLLELLLDYFGAWGTVIALFVVVLLSFLWRLYSDKQKNKYTDLLLQEKDRTIQRMADQLRELRIIYLKESKDWTDEQVEKFFITNEFSNVTEARDKLEQKN